MEMHVAAMIKSCAPTDFPFFAKVVQIPPQILAALKSKGKTGHTSMVFSTKAIVIILRFSESAR